MKRVYWATLLPCLVVLAFFYVYYEYLNPAEELGDVRVGFVYKNDESTPDTYNFSLARDALEARYGKHVEILTRSNVQEDQTEAPLRELVGKGCEIIFFNGYSEQVPELAALYPQVQFCQVSYADMTGRALPENYHTFKGELYQGRYVSGVVAGMKLKDMINREIVDPYRPMVGFVAAYPTPEVISGYTAFLLGVRSVVPNAVMRVRYTNVWSGYSAEKNAAHALIREGCAIISQHTDTSGPAVACEEARASGVVYYIGLNQSTAEVAPSVSLVSVRVNWAPYVTGAVEAVMKHRRIEASVPGRVHGTDMSAGFDRGWVEMLDLNQRLAPKGTLEAMNAAIDRFRQGGGDFVFKGDYTGVNPDDPSDTIDLSAGFKENERSSYPAFDYVLKDVVTVDSANSGGEDAA